MSLFYKPAGHGQRYRVRNQHIDGRTSHRNGQDFQGRPAVRRQRNWMQMWGALMQKTCSGGICGKRRVRKNSSSQAGIAFGDGERAQCGSSKTKVDQDSLDLATKKSPGNVFPVVMVRLQ